MDKLVISATIFMFNPVEKKWRQKAIGDVTFSLNFKDLLISTGKLSFLVIKGSVRSKGRGSVVMRVYESSQDKGARILACRFERARDVQKLFALLAGIQKIPSGPQWLKRRTPPTWSFPMKKSEQRKVEALVSKANPKYIKDGIIQRELVRLYKMTSAQVKEVMEYYGKHKIKIPAEETINQTKHGRVQSLNFDQSVITLPSTALTPSSPGWHVYPRPHSSNPLKVKIDANSRPRAPLRTAHVGGGALQNFSPKRNTSVLTPTNKAVHIGQTPRHRSLSHIEDSLNQSSRKLPNSTTAEIGFGPRISQNTLRHDELKHQKPSPRKQRHISTNDQQMKSFNKIPPSNSMTKQSPLSSKSAHLPLTSHNLLLYNKTVPPLKGDYKTLVRRWLDRSLPPEE